MSINPTQLVIILLVFSTVLSLPIAAILDANQYTNAQWQQVGHKKNTWVLLMALGALACALPGAIVAIEYLRTVRPKLQMAPG